MAGTIVIARASATTPRCCTSGSRWAAWGSDGAGAVDIAVDPLEGTNLCGDREGDAITVLAASEKGGLTHAPDTYLEKLCVGPVAAGCVDITRAERNRHRIAEALRQGSRTSR